MRVTKKQKLTLSCNYRAAIFLILSDTLSCFLLYRMGRTGPAFAISGHDSSLILLQLSVNPVSESRVSDLPRSRTFSHCGEQVTVPVTVVTRVKFRF